MVFETIGEKQGRLRLFGPYLFKEGKEKSKKAQVKELKAALIVSCLLVLIFTFS
ncbi:MAG: hypothetical protein ACYSRR_00420 [Planctomycetota bacterium]|jgi:hypothetical protein